MRDTNAPWNPAPLGSSMTAAAGTGAGVITFAVTWLLVRGDYSLGIDELDVAAVSFLLGIWAAQPIIAGIYVSSGVGGRLGIVNALGVGALYSFLIWFAWSMGFQARDHALPLVINAILAFSIFSGYLGTVALVAALLVRTGRLRIRPGVRASGFRIRDLMTWVAIAAVACSLARLVDTDEPFVGPISAVFGILASVFLAVAVLFAVGGLTVSWALLSRDAGVGTCAISGLFMVGAVPMLAATLVSVVGSPVALWRVFGTLACFAFGAFSTMVAAAALLRWWRGAEQDWLNSRWRRPASESGTIGPDMVEEAVSGRATVLELAE